MNNRKLRILQILLNSWIGIVLLLTSAITSRPSPVLAEGEVGTISGTVYESDGSPLLPGKSVLVCLAFYQSYMAGSMLDFFGCHAPGEDGTYNIQNLPPEDYIVWTQNDSGNIYEYYYERDRDSWAQRVGVVGGESTEGIDFTIPSGSGCTDPMANNYILLAFMDDGSCTYLPGMDGVSSMVRISVASNINAISPDGRYVAIQSWASNLVEGDTNGVPDIFVRDMQTGVITLVSVASDGTQGNGQSGSASISTDGRYVSFYSRSSNLVPDDTNMVIDVFVRDTQANTTWRVSVDSNGMEGNGESVYTTISADGRYVAFDSSASNLVSGDLNEAVDIFVHDNVSGSTERVSVNSSGIESNVFGELGSWYPYISADGAFVAFNSYASNLVDGDTNGVMDVFVHEMETGITRRASVSSSGEQANGESDWESLSVSSDGRFIMFQSSANNLVEGDTNGVRDVFVHDMQTGSTRRATVNSNGLEGNSWTDGPSMSQDGRFVAYHSWSTNLVEGDTNNDSDVFVHDLETGITRRISVNLAGVEGNGWSAGAKVFPDGRYVAFISDAVNLVVDDTNGMPDLFVASTDMEQVLDSDGDGIPDDVDNAPGIYNPDQRDVDGDEIADVLDPCPADETDECDLEGSAAGVIGTDGGTVVTANSQASLEIPTGNIAEPITFSITESGSGYEVSGEQDAVLVVVNSYSIQPHGTEFITPATLTFRWNDSNNDGIVDGTILQESNLVLKKDEVIINTPCYINLDCNMVENYLKVEVESLSLFELAAQENLPPSDVKVTAPSEPLPVNDIVTLQVNFSDEYDADPHEIIIEWGDGQSTNNLTPGASLSASHQYLNAGVYTVAVTVTDSVSGSGQGIFEYIVIYDPDGGFVTGGGWINSPAGAYVPDPSLAGKATFGFVSKYLKGAKLPTGNTEFQFKTADFTFKSSSYDWLVIAGARAQYKGTGTINGSGQYGFILTSIDGQVTGGNGIDRFRIKIVDKISGDLIYDNMIGAADSADPTTTLGGGSIIIHKDK